MKLLISFCLLILSHTVMGQVPNLQLSLQRSEGNISGIIGGMKATLLDTSNHYSGVPKEVDKYIVKYLELTEQDFFGPGKLAILIGKTHGDSIVLIVDGNFNSNFSDEKILLYPKNKPTNFVGPGITLKKMIKGKVIAYTFRPYPYKTNYTYHAAIENQFNLMIQTSQYLTGIIHSNAGDSRIDIGCLKPLAYYANSSMLEINVGSLGRFSVGQIIPLKDKSIVVDSVSKYGETLYYKEIDSKNSHLFAGYSKGLKVIPIEAYDIEKQNVKIPADRKMQLIDFWGTWCKPCHETLPVLKRIHKKYQDLEIIGIAYDADISAVKKYIEKERVVWKNIFQGYSSNEHPLITAMSVQEYPTFILIDEHGKVVFRGNGIDAIYEVEKVLANLFRSRP